MGQTFVQQRESNPNHRSRHAYPRPRIFLINAMLIPDTLRREDTEFDFISIPTLELVLKSSIDLDGASFVHTYT